jgi:SAM-dependent methyltransferase
MSSFLEHEAKPLELLRELRRALRPDGAVIIKVPNFASWNRSVRGGRWCGFRYPDHVNYFTPDTLARLAAEAGYRVARQRASDRAPTSDNMYAVLERA